MEAIGGWEQIRSQVIDRGVCASCGACVGRCPYMTSFKGKTVLLDRCTIEQGRCYAHCPMTFFDAEAVAEAVFGLPHQGTGIGRASAVEATRAADNAVASKAQAGGTVSALVSFALETGIIDAALVTSIPEGEVYPRGVIASSAEEVMACCGSRYVGSHSLAALREALDRGFRRIGVVGLPCQVRSVRKMAMYDLRNEGLGERIVLVIGLFCNWAFSSRELTGFLDEHFPPGEITKIHIPPPPAKVLTVETLHGTTDIPLDRLRPMIQASCGRCPDMTSEFADIAVGMYEGRDGWNTTIVRTGTGATLMASARAGNVLLHEPFPPANLEHLEVACENKRKRAASPV